MKAQTEWNKVRASASGRPWFVCRAGAYRGDATAGVSVKVARCRRGVGVGLFGPDDGLALVTGEASAVMPSASKAAAMSVA